MGGRFFLIILSMSYCCLIFSSTISSHLADKEHQADIMIVKLYKGMHQEQIQAKLSERIIWISARFLGKPYILGALGEGSNSRYDQYPRYRTDVFDCLTYVNTVLALALAHDLKSFKTWMLKLNYQHGRYIFLERNHFIEITPRPHLIDITSAFVNSQKKLVAKDASAWINQAGWYGRLPLEQIRLLFDDVQEREIRWAELKVKGQKSSKQLARLKYLPLSELFDADLHPNDFLFSQFPDAGVLEIVRPKWHLRKKIGTDLMVSHIGFIVRTAHGLVFREASQIDHVVEDVPLVDYLRAAMNSPTIKGVRISIARGTFSQW